MRNEKYTVKANDGSVIRVSQGQAKKVRQSFHMAHKLKYKLEIHHDLTFSLINKNGEYVCGSAEKGKSLNAIRRIMGNAIEAKKEQQAIAL